MYATCDLSDLPTAIDYKTVVIDSLRDTWLGGRLRALPVPDWGDACPAAQQLDLETSLQRTLPGTRGPAGHWLISLEHRTIVCAIEKVGSSQWQSLFTSLFSGNGTSMRTEATWGLFAVQERKHRLPHLGALPGGCQEAMLRNQSYLKLVVVRDPLERLLSAYLDKCAFKRQELGLLQETHASHCPGFSLGPRKKFNLSDLVSGAVRVPTLAEIVAKLAASRFITDAHWVPQSEHCSLSPLRGNATLPFFRVLRMSSPTFHKELDAVFAEAGFDPSWRQAYFPEQSGAHHRTGARSHLAAYYDRPTARRAIEIYQRDYEGFGLPLPNLREFPEASVQ